MKSVRIWLAGLSAMLLVASGAWAEDAPLPFDEPAAAQPLPKKKTAPATAAAGTGQKYKASSGKKGRKSQATAARQASTKSAKGSSGRQAATVQSKKNKTAKPAKSRKQ